MEPVILGKRGRFVFFLALTALVVGVKFMSPESLGRIEWKFQDILYEFKGESPASKDVVIVNIDELSIRELGSWPWKEEVVADLIAAVGTAGPKSVLIDFPLPHYLADQKADSGGVADQLFWMKNVVVSYDIVPAEESTDTVTNPKYLFRNALVTNSDLGTLASGQALSIRTVSLPDAKIADVASRLGFTYSSTDPDNILRSDPMVMKYQGYYYPSIPLSAASHFLSVQPENIVVYGGSRIELGDRSIPTDESGKMHLNFPVGVGFDIHSASDLLNQRMDFDGLADKLVIITLGAGSQAEYYKTPVADETPRYLLTAVAIENILSSSYLHRADSHLGWYILALTLIGLLSAYSLQKISSLYRVVVVAVGLIALANVNFFLFNTFNLLANSIYVALLLVLFLVASPLMSIDYSFLPFLRPKLETDEEDPESQRKLETRAAAANAIKTMPRRPALASSSGPIANAKANETLSFDKTMANVAGMDASHTVALTSGVGAETQHIGAPLENKTLAIDSSKIDPSATVMGDLATPAPTEDQPPAVDGPAKSDVLKSDVLKSDVLNSDVSSENAIDEIGDEATMFGDLTSAVVDAPVGAESKSQDKPPEHLPESSDSAPEPPLESAKPEPMMIPAKTGTVMGPAGKVKKLGRYQVEGILGKGAMGLVYGGIDPAINRKVALKTIRLDFLSDPDEMEEMKERLFLEAQSAGKLSHPNIVTIYDVGSEGAMQYIAMELIEGQTLEDMIKRGVNFNFKIVARMIYQICQALQYAHDAGIVHRDIKPANLMVLPDYSIKVMDFGIARVESSSMTKTGVAMGTPNYISPEQLQGQKIDGRSDLFSLGIVFYEMLVGSRPFKGDNLTSLIYSIVNTEAETPSNQNPRIPPLFDHIVMQALKKKPEERYQRASDISAALSDFVQSFATR